jgi:hypothetical protein
VAERLRRPTRNRLGLSRVGSSPAGVALFIDVGSVGTTRNKPLDGESGTTSKLVCIVFINEDNDNEAVRMNLLAGRVLICALLPNSYVADYRF